MSHGRLAQIKDSEWMNQWMDEMMQVVIPWEHKFYHSDSWWQSYKSLGYKKSLVHVTNVRHLLQSIFTFWNIMLKLGDLLATHKVVHMAYLKVKIKSFSVKLTKVPF
jgi:hypothetical protein